MKLGCRIETWTEASGFTCTSLQGPKPLVTPMIFVGRALVLRQVRSQFPFLAVKRVPAQLGELKSVGVLVIQSCLHVTVLGDDNWQLPAALAQCRVEA